MLSTFLALLARIFSNPIANAIQKFLSQKHSAILINTYSYLFLSIFCAIWLSTGTCSIIDYGLNFKLYVALAGILCTLGSICLIKALQIGEISILAPINSYKCLVGLLFGYILIGEKPLPIEFLGMILIIFGSRYIFDTVEGGFSFKLLLRKDIILRFCALFFTGSEAAILKKIILISSVKESFILWCFTGLIFSTLLLILFKVKITKFSIKELFLALGIATGLGLMQYSTNIVFEKLNVGLSLALFQLSNLIAIAFGYFIFKENHPIKKLIGALIMIIGSCVILLHN
jgi:drug/metabolite transporter (DMT)-like permease